jgi:succinate dehydrogenase / fumarate reductase flavoprotein subunit
MPSHDVLIIGAGLAGQRAALAAAQTGASVGIVSKVHPVRSHSVAAAGGINAALNPEDTWESHAYDTIKGSDYLGDQDAIEIMCREAPDEILYLEHSGVTFHRSDRGHLGTRAFGGASAARTYYVADITGQAILHVLYEQLMKHHERVDRYEEWFTTDLLQDDGGRCVGAICRKLRDGHLEVFDAKAAILACGGAGQVYEPTTNGLIVHKLWSAKATTATRLGPSRRQPSSRPERDGRAASPRGLATTRRPLSAASAAPPYSAGPPWANVTCDGYG